LLCPGILLVAALALSMGILGHHRDSKLESVESRLKIIEKIEI
jgi:hypothetical protein